MEFPVSISQVLNGIAFGMLLFLLASGLSLMFGLMGIVNLAHGGYFMVGGYIGLTTLQATGSFLLAIVAGAATGAFLGFLTERFFIRRLYGLHGHESILLTFAFSLVLSDLSLFLWTGTPRWVEPPSFLDVSFDILGALYPAYRLAIILIGLVVFFGLYWFQERTRWGAIVRAGVDDKETVSRSRASTSCLFSRWSSVWALFLRVSAASSEHRFSGCTSDSTSRLSCSPWAWSSWEALEASQDVLSHAS